MSSWDTIYITFEQDPADVKPEETGTTFVKNSRLWMLQDQGCIKCVPRQEFFPTPI